MKKYVILNSDLCDNYVRCPAMLRCEELANNSGRKPAITRNNRGIITIDRKYCIGCEECIDRCGLIRRVDGLYQEKSIRNEFKKDPRRSIRRNVERFGCDSIEASEFALNSVEDAKKYIEETSTGVINILEVVLEQTALCPIQGIEVEPIMRTFSQLDSYRKLVICMNDGEYDDSTLSFLKILKDDYNILNYPVILFIEGGRIIGEPIDSPFFIRNESKRDEEEARLKSFFEDRLNNFGVKNVRIKRNNNL